MPGLTGEQMLPESPVASIGLMLITVMIKKLTLLALTIYQVLYMPDAI